MFASKAGALPSGTPFFFQVLPHLGRLLALFSIITLAWKIFSGSNILPGSAHYEWAQKARMFVPGNPFLPSSI
jgi:hypothetical protein